jgi:hypothetical protein
LEEVAGEDAAQKRRRKQLHKQIEDLVGEEGFDIMESASCNFLS